MTTDRDSGYHKVRFGIWLPESFVSEWKRFLSRKWPEYNHGIQSLEVQLAMKRWMESEGRSAHTHKDTVLMEAENKPNFHTRKKGIVSKLTPTPTPTPLPPMPIVISNNGKSSGEEKEKSEDIFDWTKRMGVIVEPKDTEQANKIRSDPECRNQIKNEWTMRLEAKQKRQVVKSIENMQTLRGKQNKEIMKRLVAFVNHPEHSNKIEGRDENVYDNGYVSDDNLRDWIRFEYNVHDKRPIRDHIDKLVADGEIEKITWEPLMIAGKQHGKKHEVLVGWRIKNIGSLLR